MSGTRLLNSLTVTGQLTGCVEAISSLPGHWKFSLERTVGAEISLLLLIRQVRYSPPAADETVSELMRLPPLSMPWHRNTD